MLVDAPVSSMKISRSGSNSSWFSNHASRRSRMSGRSCSAAWADFFECQAAAVENGPDRAHARGDAALPREALLHLDKGDVRGCFDEAEQEGAMRIQLGAPRLSLSACRSLPALPSPPNPADGGRPNLELHRRAPGPKARQRCIDHPVPQSPAVGPCHARPPSHPGQATRILCP